MKPLEIKILIAAILVCFSHSAPLAQTEPRLVLPIGFTRGVNSISYSSKGNLVVATSTDNVSRVCDASDGRELYSLIPERSHFNFLGFASISPNSKIIITNNGDSGVSMWDIETGKFIKSLKGHNKLVSSVSFSADSRLAITASFDSTARVWQLSDGKELTILKGHENSLKTAVLSKNSILALTGSYDGTGRIWNVNSGKELKILNGHTGTVNIAIFNSSDDLVLTASDDNTARVFDVETGKCLFLLEGHSDGISAAVFSPDEKKILTGSWDKTIRIWDAKRGTLIQVIDGVTSSILDAKFSPNGELILITCNDGNCYLYQTQNGKLIRNFSNNSGAVKSSEFSPDGKKIITSSASGIVVIWDLNTWERIEVCKKYTRRIESPFFIEGGKNVVNLYGDTAYQVWDINSGRLIQHERLDIEEIKEVNSTGKFCFSFNKDKAKDNQLSICNCQTNDEIFRIFGHIDKISSIVLSPDDRFLISTSLDHKTILWETATGKPLYTRLQLKDNDWLVYDENYRFDGTPGAIEKLYFTCGLEVIELGQMKDALYVPGLVSKIMNGEDINYQKLSDLEICGALPLIEKVNEDKGMWEFKIEERKWPIVRLDLKVDGKTVSTIPTNSLKWDNRIASLKLFRHDLEKHFKPGEENKITVIAITEFEKREFQSRGVELEILDERKKSDPNMYMLMIGVNDYKDDALDLKFPVSDARAFGSALESSAKKMLGNDKVFVYNVQSKNDNTNVFTTPERAGIMKALEEIGSKAQSNDLLFIFFAGHGVMHGIDNTFTFLTADASKVNPIGISTADLKSWLSPEGPFKMLPNKTVLVYDACNSGQAAKEIYADLASARDNDATERQRQIEDLGDKSGVFILAASAPNQSAYELPHLGQGMLTYCMLKTLKNNTNLLDEEQDGVGFLNLQKWFLETEREQNRLMESLGLEQKAQPYGNANIRIGVVDDELRKNISLLNEKPLVYCSSARDDSEEDPLELRKAVNAGLEEATSRGESSKIGYIKAETSQANILKLVYTSTGENVQCRILIFKDKLKINEININTSTSKAAEDVVKAVEGVVR